MGTLIICANDQCMYAKLRKDGLYQCSCTTIGITKENKCDTYMVLPVKICDLKRFKSR